MSEQNREGWLEELLSAPEAYIEDDGFTDQVMARLPMHSRKWQRALVRLVVLGAVALAFVWVIGDWVQAFKSLQGVSSTESAPPAALWMLVGGMVAIVWVPLTIAFEDD